MNEWLKNDYMYCKPDQQLWSDLAPFKLIVKNSTLYINCQITSLFENLVGKLSCPGINCNLCKQLFIRVKSSQKQFNFFFRQIQCNIRQNFSSFFKFFLHFLSQPLFKLINYLMPRSHWHLGCSFVINSVRWNSFMDCQSIIDVETLAIILIFVITALTVVLNQALQIVFEMF